MIFDTVGIVFSQCMFHLVFVAKYRHGVFTKEILDDLRRVVGSVCRDFEAELIEFDGEGNHVHLLVNYPPKVAISILRQYIEQQQTPL